MKKSISSACAVAFVCAGVLAAQGKKAAPPKPAVPKPFQSQSTSSVALTGSKDGEQTLEITNVDYQVLSSYVPGRPPEEKLLLRQTTHTKQVLGDKGIAVATTTLEAWPLGADLKSKPIYTVNAEGIDGRVVDTDLFVVARGLEDVEWWSVYKLGTGEHLMDTYVPLLGFSINREEYTQRYIGIEVPGDDVKDARLKDPKVVAVITYATSQRVKREALLTADDAKQAANLRAFYDTTRTVAVLEGSPPKGVKLTFTRNPPGPATAVTVSLPIANDDLDLAHATVPPKLHLADWKR
jgi:hypothetical protein